MKYFSLLIVFLLNLQGVQAQEYENDSILIWNENRQLTWDNFQNKSISKRSMKAGIEPALKLFPNPLSYSDIKDVLVVAIVYKYDSWVKEEKELLLNHEQIHFNITELYTRKIRKDLQKYLDDNKSYELDSIAKIYHCLEDEFWETQFLYDKETNHSKNAVGQKKWDKKIDSLLQVYKDYERNYTIEDLEEKE